MTTINEQCSNYKRCSGCQLQNMTYDAQLRWKQVKVERLMHDLCKISVIKGMDTPLHYRNKVTAVFRTTQAGRMISGVYQSATNGIVATESCMLNSKRADRIVVAARTAAKRVGLTTYNPKTGKGFLRSITVRTARGTGEIMVTITTAGRKFTQHKEFVKQLLSLYPKITTIVQTVNQNPQKLMPGIMEKVLYGNGYIYDTMCGSKFKISPLSFYQVNSIQTEYLYKKAIDMAGITQDTPVLDAYCGTGTIGIIAAKYAKSVVGIEQNPAAVKDAKENAKLNNRSNMFFYTADAGEFLQQWHTDTEKPSVVFMDPPRNGSSHDFLQSLVNMSPEKIVYISCNPETQQRDIIFLVKNGSYKVKEVQPVDMFPYTNHVECVVLLTKVQK